jgi:hypothetical protein
MTPVVVVFKIYSDDNCDGVQAIVWRYDGEGRGCGSDRRCDDSGVHYNVGQCYCDYDIGPVGDHHGELDRDT